MSYSDLQHAMAKVNLEEDRGYSLTNRRNVRMMDLGLAAEALSNERRLDEAYLDGYIAARRALTECGDCGAELDEKGRCSTGFYG